MNQIPYVGKFLDYGLLGAMFALSLVVVYKLYQKNQDLEEEIKKDALSDKQHVTLVLEHVDDTMKAILINLENHEEKVHSS